MNNPALIDAIKHVVEQGQMTQAYRDRLTALIRNQMRASIDDTDIDELLEMIDVEDSHDED